MSIRILLIEDEDAIADFLTRGLREEGWTVERAADGLAGWERLETEKWDVVLLDWRLPRLEGIQVLKRFRAIDSATPVLFLTARDSVTDRVTGLNDGADDYLTKPFAFDELLARVRALTRRGQRSPAGASQLVYTDVTIDLVGHRVQRAGERIELTSKEESLLTYFLRHPEQVLTRTRIYEAVWDERYDGLSNTLEVHVMELRRKLEQHGPRLIQTVRGRGYRLSEEA